MASSFPGACIMVFSKAPVPGEVKTRLSPPLSPTAAARLHARLLEHTLATAVSADLCQTELWCAPDTSHTFFQHCAHRFGVPLHRQQGADLGARMANAVSHALNKYHTAVVVGTDCPALTAEHYKSSLHALHEDVDAVLGPAIDGGYVLLGMRKLIDELFREIPWGTQTVAQISRERLAAGGLSWRELEVLVDIDRPQDLAHLPSTLWSLTGDDVDLPH